MRILVSWLREFVEVTATPEELGHTLSMRGFELASIEPVPVRGSDPVTDFVLDFEITANRPDALSVIGLAREAATAFSLPMRQRSDKGLPADSAGMKVTLEDPDLCPRYAAAVADVTVAPSPTWLASRLLAAGVRPINNVVDVTNYVMLELGQPMHAFDQEKLAGGELRARRAKKGERITTLDGTDRGLDPDMLVIADADRAQAIAGIMGGRHSEVSAGTRTIVLESACFNPKSVRLTGRRLGLKTEASARFERGTDINGPVPALERAITLLETIGAGRARGGVTDRYPAPVVPRTLALRRARIARVLGQEVADADIQRILNGLGCRLEPNSLGWDVTVPTFRLDMSREVDLIEEIGRHHGYDRLPTTFPVLSASTPPPDPRIERERLVRRVLLAAGCSEALSFSFIEAGLAALFADAEARVGIANPLSAQFSVMRPSLLPGLLTAIAHNRNRERADVLLFELGATVTRTGEDRRVAVAWTGNTGRAHWSAGRRNVDFFDVKGLVTGIAEALRVDVTFDAISLPSYLMPGRAARVLAGPHVVGALGMLTPASVTAVGGGAKDEVYVAELGLNALAVAQSPEPMKAKALPRYPSIARDISIIIDDTLPAGTVRGTIHAAAPDTLVSVQEFDRYQGKGVPDRRVSLSLRLTFRSPDRTLTDSDVQKAMDAILGALKRDHQAVQR